MFKKKKDKAKNLSQVITFSLSTDKKVILKSIKRAENYSLRENKMVKSSTDSQEMGV